MKTIGLIGGTSYASTLDYYRILNEQINIRLGGLHSAKILMHSVNYQTAIYEPKMRGDWTAIGQYFPELAVNIEAGGADMLMICANMPHKIADMITNRITIPLIHIGQATGEHIAKQGYQCVGLLGARAVMEEDYIKKHYFPHGQGRVIVPDETGRDIVDSAIFNEMCKGLFSPETRTAFCSIIDDLHNQGAEAVVMGCTEIPILMQNVSVPVPLLDTMHLHCLKAVDMAFEENEELAPISRKRCICQQNML